MQEQLELVEAIVRQRMEAESKQVTRLRREGYGGEYALTWHLAHCNAYSQLLDTIQAVKEGTVTCP